MSVSQFDPQAANKPALELHPLLPVHTQPSQVGNHAPEHAVLLAQQPDFFGAIDVERDRIRRTQHLRKQTSGRRRVDMGTGYTRCTKNGAIRRGKLYPAHRRRAEERRRREEAQLRSCFFRWPISRPWVDLVKALHSPCESLLEFLDIPVRQKEYRTAVGARSVFVTKQTFDNVRSDQVHFALVMGFYFGRPTSRTDRFIGRSTACSKGKY